MNGTFLGLDTGRMGLVNPANALTLARLVLGVIGVLAFQFSWFGDGPGGQTLAIVIIAIAASTDFDGKLARRYDCASEFGRLFDPTADKIFMIGVGIWAIWHTDEYWVVTALMVSYQVVIALWSIWANQVQKREIHVDLLGKWAIGVNMVALVLLLLAATWWEELSLMWRVLPGVIALVATFLSAINLSRMWLGRLG